MTHSYNTYKEIIQQPRMWLKTLDYVRAHKRVIGDFTEKYLQAGYEIVLTGAGTSAYIGDALEPALFSTRFRGARAIATTDILTNPQMYFDRDSKVLLVSFARSGNSPESVGVVRAVEKTAGKTAHIFITCNKDGELARMEGDNILCLLLPPETNDLSLAMTSSYSTMLLCCSMVANIDRIDEDAPLIEEVAAWLEENKLRAQAYFIVDDLKYLKRGGRISATAATVGTMLDLKPIISEAPDGTLTANDKIRGRKKAIAFIVDINRIRKSPPSLS